MKTSKSKILLVVLAVILIFGASYFIYHSRSQKKNTVINNNPGLQDVNLNPPTDQDKQSVDQHKDDLSNKVQDQSQNTAPSGSIKAVTPVITDASQYDQQVEVRAYIPGIIEGTGTCEFIFTHGSLKVTKQSPGVKDATTTRCTNLSVSRSEFATAGQWTLVVKYSSSTSSGTSNSKIVTIQ